MAETKMKDFRIFMVSPDGEHNRTIELQAKDKASAQRAAERQADDIVDQAWRAAGEPDSGPDEPYAVKTVEAI